MNKRPIFRTLGPGILTPSGRLPEDTDKLPVFSKFLCEQTGDPELQPDTWTLTPDRATPPQSRLETVLWDPRLLPHLGTGAPTGVTGIRTRAASVRHSPRCAVRSRLCLWLLSTGSTVTGNELVSHLILINLHLKCNTCLVM